MREHNQVDVGTGKRTVIPYTDEENAAADKATADEKVRQDAERLVEMKAEAVNAELAALVDTENGNTQAAKDYQAEKVKQRRD